LRVRRGFPLDGLDLVPQQLPQLIQLAVSTLPQARGLDRDAGHPRYASGKPRGVLLLLQQADQRQPQRADLRLEPGIGRGAA
jgi:hypothetical protein